MTPERVLVLLRVTEDCLSNDHVCGRSMSVCKNTNVVEETGADA